jgi:hypothetical protein
MEDDSPVEAVSTPNTPRNLAAWKISIPYVDFFEDPSSERKEKKERIPVFCIDVERNDRRAGKSSEPSFIIIIIKFIYSLYSPVSALPLLPSPPLVFLSPFPLEGETPLWVSTLHTSSSPTHPASHPTYSPTPDI